MPSKQQYKYTKESFQNKLNQLTTAIDVIGEYCGSHSTIMVQCKNCGYIWNPLPSNLLKGQIGCPCCIGKIAVKGINSFYDTHHHLALLLKNVEDSYDNLKCSKKVVDWVCPNCGLIIQKSFEKVTQRGHLVCPVCADGLSYPSKFVASVLKQSDIKFETEKTFNWSNNKRYDFYLPNYNCIIEVHGGQHYAKDGYMHGLEYQQKNDHEKMITANNNGIAKYIVIDARKSDKDFISQNIINSSLFDMIDLNKIDWNQCAMYATSSLKYDALKLWNDGIRTTTEISNIIGIHQKTVRGYLKEFVKLGMCDYNAHEAMVQNGKSSSPSNKRPVLCITTGEIFESITMAKTVYDVYSIGNIIQCCKNKRNYAGKLPDGTPLQWQYVT